MKRILLGTITFIACPIVGAVGGFFVGLLISFTIWWDFVHEYTHSCTCGEPLPRFQRYCPSCAHKTAWKQK